MSRRPKTLFLLSLLGAATPFQASSSSGGKANKYGPTICPGSPHAGGDSQDAHSKSDNRYPTSTIQQQSSELYAANYIPTSTSAAGAFRGPTCRLPYGSNGGGSGGGGIHARRPATTSSRKSRVVVRKTNGLVLKSTISGLASPLSHEDVFGDNNSYSLNRIGLFSDLRAGAAAGVAASLTNVPSSAAKSQSQRAAAVRQIGQFTARAGLCIGAFELLARMVGLTATGGTTLLVPSILAPLLTPLLDKSATVLSILLGPFFTVQLWSTLAPFASIALKLSPMPTIQTVRKRGTTGGLPLLPYSAMCTMTFVLVAYGILIDDTRVMITHGAGHLISLYYCLTFYQHVDKGASNLPGTVGMHARTGLSIAAAIVVAILALGRRAAPTVGMTSVVLSCLMYTGPLTALREAIRSKSAQNIPLPYALASSVNALAWMVYGMFGIHDVMIWAPCLIGFASATAQIVVNILYENGPEGLQTEV